MIKKNKMQSTALKHALNLIILSFIGSYNDIKMYFFKINVNFSGKFASFLYFA